jgi:hypothetical protein
VLQGTETAVAVTAAVTTSATGDAPTASTAVNELPRPDWEGMTRVLDGFRGDMESKSEVCTISYINIYIL